LLRANDRGRYEQAGAGSGSGDQAAAGEHYRHAPMVHRGNGGIMTVRI
jgi:hypothetical protein